MTPIQLHTMLMPMAKLYVLITNLPAEGRTRSALQGALHAALATNNQKSLPKTSRLDLQDALAHDDDQVPSRGLSFTVPEPTEGGTPPDHAADQVVDLARVRTGAEFDAPEETPGVPPEVTGAAPDQDLGLKMQSFAFSAACRACSALKFALAA